MTVNKQIIVGNLGVDPETRFTASGKQVTEIRVATSYGSGDNKITEWFRVVAWEKLAEVVAKSLKKGSKVYIEGRTQTRTYDQDGVKKYITEVIATEIRFLDKAPTADEAADPEPPRRKAKPTATPVDDSDIPF